MNGTVFSVKIGMMQRDRRFILTLYAISWRIRVMSPLPIWRVYCQSRSMVLIPPWICLMNFPWQIPAPWLLLQDLRSGKWRYCANSIKWIFSRYSAGMMAIASGEIPISIIRVQLSAQCWPEIMIISGIKQRHLKHCVIILSWIIRAWKTLWWISWPAGEERLIQTPFPMIWQPFSQRMMYWPCWCIWDIWDMISYPERCLFQTRKYLRNFAMR